MKIISLLLGILLLTGATCRRTPYMPQPKGYVYVPGGDFKIDGQVHKIHSFWMAQNEVTNKQYKDYLIETGKEPSASQYQVLKNGIWAHQFYDYMLNPIFENFPVVGLSRSEMLEYAKWLSLKVSKENGIWPYEFRLPTVLEWPNDGYQGNGMS
jgi:formylglycine-generating enzyme required for sulfatase activity